MKKEQDRVLVVAQEIHFAKALAANDKQLRERALRRLNKWLCLKAKSSLEFTEEGFMRIWKGLFYCVWMSDKPLVQETTVEAISQLLHCFIKFEDSLKFMSCFYQAMSQAWFGLDQHRLDKYMMLVRRFIRQSFMVMKNQNWNENNLREFGEVFFKALTVAPVGFVMHLADVYIVELSKVGDGKLENRVVVALVKPWARLLATQSDIRIINAVKSHVFLYLIRQTDLAIKHAAKFDAWKQRGFPGGDIDMMEEVAIDESDSDLDVAMDDNDDEVFLDPRAGRADTVLPPVEFEPSDMVNLLNTTKISQLRTLAARQSKSISALIDKFKELENEKYPLGIKRVERPQDDDDSSEDEVDKAIERLSTFEDILYQDSKTKMRKRKTNSVFSEMDGPINTWDISESNNQEDGICLTLSPHSLASSPWTVDSLKENGTEEHEVVKIKRRKLSNGCLSSPKIDTTPLIKPSQVVKEESSTPTTSMGSIKKKKMNKQNREGGIDISLTRLTPSTSSLPCKGDTSNKKNARTPSSGKKVLFALSKNKAQDADEYAKTVEKSPLIPYDASKKPRQGVLKPSPFASPIDPFYMKKIARCSRKKSF